MVLDNFNQLVTQLLNEGAHKQAIPIDYKRGDRVTVTQAYLNDKKRAQPKTILKIKRLYRELRQSNYTLPIYEVKCRGQVDGALRLIYAIEISKFNPPTHILCYTDVVQNRNIPNTTIKLVKWFRIFEDYNDYERYLSSVQRR